MEKNQRLGKASKALFIVSLVLGIVMLILSALAIALAAFKNNGRTDESTELLPVDDTSSAPKTIPMIESTGAVKPSRKE